MSFNALTSNGTMVLLLLCAQIQLVSFAALRQTKQNKTKQVFEEEKHT